MVRRKCSQHKLRAVRRFDISNVVTRGAGPTSLGPETKSFATLQRNACESKSLVVWIAALTGVVALQQFHHRGGARRVGGFAGDNFHHQARGGVSRQLVEIFAIWTTRNALTPVSIFTKSFLVNVDVGVAERREVTVDGVALILPLLHLFRRQLIAAGRVREPVDDVLRRFI